MCARKATYIYAPRVKEPCIIFPRPSWRAGLFSDGIEEERRGGGGGGECSDTAYSYTMYEGCRELAAGCLRWRFFVSLRGATRACVRFFAFLKLGYSCACIRVGGFEIPFVCAA